MASDRPMITIRDGGSPSGGSGLCRLAVFLVVLLLSNHPGLAAGLADAPVVRLYQRVVELGEALLSFERVVLVRLEKARPVDVTRAVARFRSARDQMRRLRKMAKGLAKQLPPGDPALAEVERRKARLQEIKAIHQANMARIQSLASADFAAAFTLAEEAFRSDDDGDEVISFPRTLKDQF